VTSTKGHVYVVDDDSAVRRALARMLKYAGYKVVTFASAEEFLAHAGREQPACLVLDVRMSNLDGFELLELLQADARNLPVIFITGHGDVRMAKRARKAGAADFLAKPIDEHILLDAVERALGPARLRDAG
jgi:FixJ family two-component response regulator